MGVSLDALPFDVLLRIFHYLSSSDVSRTCQTCKYLRTVLEERHAWLELSINRCLRNASAARYAPTALSTAELRTLVVQQARVDRYWAASTVLTNPLPHFTFRASIPLQFCKVLPGGKHLILVYRNGDISLQSLVDLDNIHEIANHKLSLDPLNGHAYIVSLATDHNGRLLLAVCMYGLPSRIFFLIVKTETRSINLVRRIKVGFPVIAIAVQRVIVCLCQHRRSFRFVIATLDETEKVLRTSQIPVDPAFTSLYDIYLPTPTTLILFQASDIRCYHLPDPSELPPGRHHLSGLSPIWSWETPSLSKARLTFSPVDWESCRTTPTVITFLCDFLSHTLTLSPSKKSLGPSHLDVTHHACTNVSRPISLQSQGTTPLRSQRGIWFKLENAAESLHDFRTFSTDDVQRTGLVRFVGIWEQLVTAVDFDEISGRIVVLGKALDEQSDMGYGIILDMP